MEDLSVEVYGDNGAYYKVCKLWSTLKYGSEEVNITSVKDNQLFPVLSAQL